jgi:hypothetical protein
MNIDTAFILTFLLSSPNQTQTVMNTNVADTNNDNETSFFIFFSVHWNNDTIFSSSSLFFWGRNTE